MADFYVDSNATGANNGTSWTDAWTTITSAPGGISAGDRVFVASDHSESQASLMSLSWPGTVASLNHIISADSTSGTPPTTQTSGASVATTGANDIQIISSGYIYMWGIAFNAGDGASLASIIIANSSAGSDSVLEDCVFVLGNTSSSSRIIIANDTDAKVYLKNCNFQFDAATQGVNTGTIGAPFIVDGGSLIGSTFPNNFIANTADETRIFISGFDFSSGSSSMNIIGDTDSNITGYVRNCKLPSSWTGSLRTTNQLGSDIILSNSDNSDTNYNYEKITHTGNILSETTIVKDSGASDGATVLSWKMVSNANAIYPKNTLESTEIVKWNGVVGSSITVT
ncbi:MAG: hypothetical protein GTN99_00505, partial [Candidatus Dadabacteria bacterium]|nr:hypothetical protein [Candidatus Dadabacteria bacterium]